MKLVYNSKGVLRYLVNPGLEIQFDKKLRKNVWNPHGRYYEAFGEGGVQFRNSDPKSDGIDWIVLFHAEAPFPVAWDKTSLVKHETSLHRAFLSILDGNPPEPFLDLLTETYPDLQDLVDKYLRERG